MNTFLLELLNERFYAVQKSAFFGFRSNVMRYLETRVPVHVEREPGLRRMARFVNGMRTTSDSLLSDFKAMDDDDWDDDDDDDKNAPSGSVPAYVNILAIRGPITRGGGECSYGSIEMRDRLINAANRDDVAGHIIYCRTPGGAASALLDFRKAIDHIHSRGQKVYMFCDGTVASCGVFLGAMCDGIYAYNENDEIGSIGLFCSMFALKNGAENAITKETYVEVYADKSTQKNQAEREAADGDLELLRKETNKELDRLLSDFRADRPSIKEEQMTGAMYRMKDVEGSLVDGFCTLGELVDRVFAESVKSGSEEKGGQGDSDSGNKSVVNDNNMNAIKKTEMAKEYKQISRLAGYGEGVWMTSDVDGTITLQSHEADAVEKAVAHMSALSEENVRMKEERVALGESLNAMTLERDAARKEVASLKDALASLDEKVKEKEKELADKEAEYASQLDEKEQVISDLNAKLEEADNGIAKRVTGGVSPDNNGDAACAMRMTSAPQWDPNLSPMENKKALDEYLACQKAKVGK